MSLGLIFWILMLIWLVFGMWSNWPASGSASESLRPMGGTVLLFILLLLLGWNQFGPPIHG